MHKKQDIQINTNFYTIEKENSSVHNKAEEICSEHETNQDKDKILLKEQEEYFDQVQMMKVINGLTKNFEAMKLEHERTIIELKQVKTELAELKTQLVEFKTNFEDTKSDLECTNAELEETKTELDDLRCEHQDEIDRLDSEISDLKDELEDTLNNSEKESTSGEEYERKKFKKIRSDKVAPLKQKIVNKPQSAETISPSQFQFIPVQPPLSLNQNERKSHSTACSDPNKNKKYKLVALEYDISDFTQDPPLKPLNQNNPSESTPQIPPSNRKQNKKNNKKIPRTNEQPLLKTEKQLQALATKHDIPLQFVTDIYTSRSRQLSLGKTILSVWSFDWDKYAIQANATHQEWPYLSIACKIAADITGFEESYIKTILSITTRHLRYKGKKEKDLKNQ